MDSASGVAKAVIAGHCSYSAPRVERCPRSVGFFFIWKLLLATLNYAFLVSKEREFFNLLCVIKLF